MWYGPNPWRRLRPQYPYFIWILLAFGFVIFLLLVLLAFLIVFIIKHIGWIIPAIIGIAIYKNRRKIFKQKNTSASSQQTYSHPAQQQTASQTQTIPYYTPPQPPYQPYDRGYQSDQRAYQPQSQPYRVDHHESQEQTPATSYDDYDQPKAEYPQQMPPM
jgi:hypothetical protein